MSSQGVSAIPALREISVDELTEEHVLWGWMDGYCGVFHVMRTGRKVKRFATEAYPSSKGAWIRIYLELGDSLLFDDLSLLLAEVSPSEEGSVISEDHVHTSRTLSQTDGGEHVKCDECGELLKQCPTCGSRYISVRRSVFGSDVKRTSVGCTDTWHPASG